MHLRKTYKIGLLFAVAIVLLQIGCSKFDKTFQTENSAILSGGQQTVFDAGSGAFGHPFPVMPENLQDVHEVGDAQFEATFVSAPAPLNPGRGPLFNNVSCSACHISDGRGKVPGIGDTSVSTLFRVSIPGTDAHGGPNPVPGFGDQIQNRSIFNTQKEADVAVSYLDQRFSFDDGT
ncbi:MAG TPA: di-heme oxidoredictase family protein, partial [Chitinophagaceae bacterium]|nr:di-heme oxidoredictase family protein [Chitinophagaceae bacterium]